MYANWRTAARKVGEIGETVLLAWDGDITRIVADAVVVTDNPAGYMAGSVANAVKSAWGWEIEERSISLGPFEEGAAWSTPAGHRAPVEHVIHAAAMSFDHRTSESLVATSTFNVLRESDRLGLKTIAFTALASGVAHLPIDQCARAMAAGIERYFSELSAPSQITHILFVLWGSQPYRSFLAAFSETIAPGPVSPPS